MDFDTLNSMFPEVHKPQNSFKFGNDYSPCIFDDTNKVNETSLMDADKRKAIYAKIPRNIITDKDCSSYRAMIFAMMYFQSPLASNKFCVSYHAFGFLCNFKVDFRYTKKNFVDLLERYQEYDYIKILSFAHNQNVAMIQKNEKFNLVNEERYGIIYENELNVICHFDGYSTRINQSHVLLVLAFIRCSYSHIDGIFERGCYMHISNISEQIGFKDKLVTTCIDYLVQMNILRTQKSYDFKIDDKWLTGYTVFVDAQDVRGDGFYGKGQINKLIKYLNNKKKSYPNIERGD